MAGAPHVGTRDVDLAVVLAVDGLEAEGYETLERNLRDGGFRQDGADPGFRWRRAIDDRELVLEFLCDTDAVGPGRLYRPKTHTGSAFQALNVAGVRHLPRDFRLVEIEAVRLDGGGLSRVGVRVAGVAVYVALKISAYCDRHYSKDAYDLVFTLRHHDGGPSGAGRAMAASPVISEPEIAGAIDLQRERFADAGNDAPVDYAAFEGSGSSDENLAQLRNEAVEVVRLALAELPADRARST